jgi:hypothetical protein
VKNQEGIEAENRKGCDKSPDGLKVTLTDKIKKIKP